jgi:hypothetical protein
VAWRRCSRRRRRSRRRGRSCSRSGSFPSADGLLSSLRDGGCGLQPWRVDGAPVRPCFAAPRPLLPHFSPSLLPLRRRTEERGKTPMRVGGWLADAWSRGIGLPAEAVQGQKCSAHGIGRTAEGATWPCALGRQSPRRRGERGKRVFSSP